MTKEILRTIAHEYLDRGFSVVPANGKIPMSNWKEFQTRRPTHDEIDQWFDTLAPTGIAIVTGKISGIAVLDVEKNVDRPKLGNLPVTLAAQSGGGGYHYYYKYPVGKTLRPINLRTRGIEGDFQADGKVIIAPPSIHPITGRSYEWITSPEEALADIPQWILDMQENPVAVVTSTMISDKKKEMLRIFGGVPEGQRHNASVKIIGKLLYEFKAKDWDLVWKIAQAVNRSNKPPLGESELLATFTDLSRRHALERSTREQSSGKKIKLLSMADVLSLPEKEHAFLVDTLIPYEGITVLSGTPSSGKTWVMLSIAKAVALGEPLFGMFPTQRRSVLITDEENGADELKRRMKMLQFPEDINIRFSIKQGVKVDQEEYLDELVSLVEEKEIGLVVFDPLVAIHSRPENDAGEMQKVMEAMQKINAAGAVVLFLHHHRKGSWNESSPSQSLRGSSALAGRADSHFALEKMRGSDSQSVILRLTQDKLRVGKPSKPLTIELKEEDGHMDITCEESSVELVAQELAKEAILIALKDAAELSREDVLEVVRSNAGVGKRNAGDALRELDVAGLVSKRKDGKRNLYSIPEAISDVSEGGINEG